MLYRDESYGQAISNDNCQKITGYEMIEILRILSSKDYSDLVCCPKAKESDFLRADGIYPEVKIRVKRDDINSENEYRYNFQLGENNKNEYFVSCGWNSFAL